MKSLGFETAIADTQKRMHENIERGLYTFLIAGYRGALYTYTHWHEEGEKRDLITVVSRERPDPGLRFIGDVQLIDVSDEAAVQTFIAHYVPR